ncbi:hypothetical protein KSP39_PZI021471 [Platanthera zijinensis]|uniref:Expansin-like EG45 domain-containing protein n=1 Tax=Platanthera zijinensis TaxID=2320716 RepID=A0AAP0AY26_9ASPA
MGIKGTYNNLLAIVLFFGLVAVLSAQEYVVASYYTQPYTPSACFGLEDKGVALISLSDKLWDGGKACGSRYFLNCKPGNDCIEHLGLGSAAGIVAMVVDNCGDCGGAAMLLSEEVFIGLGKLEVGTVLVSYQKSM